MKIFISYNHDDQETAFKIKNELTKSGFEVIIDAEKMLTGEDIKQFILNSIKESGVTLTLISTNSLKSAWVAMETIISNIDEKLRERLFIPCYLDRDFLERDFAEKVLAEINIEVNEIDKLIINRISKRTPIDDLQNVRKRYLEMITFFPEFIGKYKDSLCVDLGLKNFKKGIEKIIDDLKYQKNITNIYSLNNNNLDIKKSLNKLSYNYDNIYLCDRNEVNQEFNNYISNKAFQFFVLRGHEKDLLEKFLKRKQIEEKRRSNRWDIVKIEPFFPDSVDSFEKVEAFIKTAIWTSMDELRKKVDIPQNLTIKSLFDYMDKQKIDCLAFEWSIESAIWKNNNLKNLIVSFYNHYSNLSVDRKTNKRILFFGILRYAEKSKISEKEFYKIIKDLQWENNLQNFKKIRKLDIQNWITDKIFNADEYVNLKCEELIKEHFKNQMEEDLYYSEIIEGLKKVIDCSNK